MFPNILSFVLSVFTSFRNVVDGPSATDSANSHHGNFSLVQNTKGMAEKRNFTFHHRIRGKQFITDRLTPGFLKTQHIHFGFSRQRYNFADLFVNGIPLFGYRSGRRKNDFMLNDTYSHDPVVRGIRAMKSMYKPLSYFQTRNNGNSKITVFLAALRLNYRIWNLWLPRRPRFSHTNPVAEAL